MKQNKVCNKSTSLIVAQTEGDTGYDYNDAYEDEFYDESGTLCDAMQRYATAILSVRLSVRPFATLVDYVKTAKDVIPFHNKSDQLFLFF